MLTEFNPYLAVVFCNTKDRTKKLAGDLIARGFNVAELQGDMSQGRRNQVMRDFAKAKTQILVASDIAARGIDIEGIPTFSVTMSPVIRTTIFTVSGVRDVPDLQDYPSCSRQVPMKIKSGALNTLYKQRSRNTRLTVRLRQ